MNHRITLVSSITSERRDKNCSTTTLMSRHGSSDFLLIQRKKNADLSNQPSTPPHTNRTDDGS